jgi:hypothetical protein
VILLVAGSQALDDTEAAESWAKRLILASFGIVAIGGIDDGTEAHQYYGRRGLVHTLITGGGTHGPDEYAERIASALEVRSIAYDIDGTRWLRGASESTAQENGRWRAEEGAATEHERNRFMLRGLRTLNDQGKQVNVVTLLASWAPDDDPARKVGEWARALALPVTLHELCSPTWDGMRDVLRCFCGHPWEMHTEGEGCGYLDMAEDGTTEVLCDCRYTKPAKPAEEGTGP